MKYTDFYSELLEIKSQQDTPEFKNWFKNSKVVDDQGNPLRAYHGTSKDKDFSKFTEKQNGMWFTSSPESASSYADQNDSMKSTYGYRGNIEHINTASRVIPVYLSIQNPAINLTKEQEDKLRYSDNYTKAQREVFAELKAQGHDGVDMGGGVYVVFRPEQIKSAIGNTGKFNPSDQHIHK
jgi:hypothetical protein